MEMVNWEQFRERYEGSAAWLVCGGPSVRGFDFSRLGDTVAAINEIGRDIPNLDIWIGNDTLPVYPCEFWSRDCLKLIRKEQADRPKCEMRNTLEFRSNQQPISGPTAIRERLFFDPERVFWGGPAITEEGRATIKKSAMLMALGVLFRMGFCEVRLLGCDWQTSIDQAYGHSHKQVEDVDIRRSVNQFRYLEQWFEQLLPMWEARQFRIVNCTDGGLLEVFERRDWDSF